MVISIKMVILNSYSILISFQMGELFLLREEFNQYLKSTTMALISKNTYQMNKCTSNKFHQTS